MTASLSWSDLELVLAIHRAQSLSGAGRLLGVKQSTVSRRLQDLEERIGMALFVRTREGVVATTLGSSWIEPALQAELGVLESRRILAEHQQDGVAGLVRLATLHIIADYILLPRLDAFLSRYPALQLSIEPSATIADMTRLEADIALRLVRPTQGELIVKRWAHGPVHPYAAHGLATRIRHMPMARWPWISWSNPMLMAPPERELFAQHNITPRLLFSSATTMIEATRRGLGVVLIGDGLAAQLPELEPLPMPESWDVSSSLWLVTHKKTRHTARVQAVWDWLVEMTQQM